MWKKHRECPFASSSVSPRGTSTVAQTADGGRTGKEARIGVGGGRAEIRGPWRMVGGRTRKEAGWGRGREAGIKVGECRAGIGGPRRTAGGRRLDGESNTGANTEELFRVEVSTTTKKHTRS
jgi:hypothetical protein